MLHEVKKIKYLDGYRIELIFDDGNVKIVDLQDFLKNAKHMLAPLKDIDYFKKVKCDGTTVVWPNGVDLCPDVLYKMGTPASVTKRKRKAMIRVPSRRKKSNAAKTGRLVMKK